MPTSTNPLALIAGGSPAAARIALDAIRAQQNDSPMAAARAARAAKAALEDPRATFSADERRAIAEILDTERGTQIQIRLTVDERTQLKQMAHDAGLSISDFIRQKVGL